MAVLPGVLGCRPLQRTVQVRLGTNTLRLPGGPTIFVVSRQRFMRYPGLGLNRVVSHENIRAKIEKDEGYCLRGPVPWLKMRLRGEISKVGIIV